MILPIIADLYTPLIVIAWLQLIILMKSQSQEPHFYTKQALVLIGNLTVVYGVMLIDMFVHIWSSIGWDYSTHTAIVWAFIISMWSFSKRRFWWSTCSLMIYGQLMWWLDYHTWSDIISTSAVVVPLLWLWQIKIHKKAD